jgi:hypothetical protein
MEKLDRMKFQGFLMISIKEGLRRSFAVKANEFSLLLDTVSLSISKFEGALEVCTLKHKLT